MGNGHTLKVYFGLFARWICYFIPGKLFALSLFSADFMHSGQNI